MQVSKDKRYETKDGRPVRIYVTDAGGRMPIHGAVLTDDRWVNISWTEEGYTTVPQWNLVELRPLSEVTVVELMEVLPENDEYSLEIGHYGFSLEREGVGSLTVGCDPNVEAWKKIKEVCRG